MSGGWRTALVLMAGTVQALDLGLPTGNDAVLRPGGDAAYFQPTIEGTIESGMFGCVRGRGGQFHEGVDIQCRERDRRGEPVDPVLAAAAGRVAFINRHPGLSNYGRYVVLEHRWDGVAVFTLYAHLREVVRGLAVGQWLAKGHPLAVLGRSTNTGTRISRERAHLHFEICFLINPMFERWYRQREPKAPPLGPFNGQNLIGLDPVPLMRATAADPKLPDAPGAINFAEYVARQPLGFTVLVPAARLPWAALHPEQIRAASAAAVDAERSVIAEPQTNGPTSPVPALAAANIPAPATVAYEVGLTAWGLPVALWPRTAKQVAGRNLPALNLVSEPQLARNNCRRLVERTDSGWQLSGRGRDWIELLTFSNH